MDSQRNCDRAHERRINRDHLFSGRIFCLAKKFEGKPIPCFEKSTRLFTLPVKFHGANVTLLLSQNDHWTNHYVRLLKKFTLFDRHPERFQSFTGMVLGLAASFTDVIPQALASAFRGLTRTFVTSSATTIAAIGILLKSDDPFICMSAIGIITAQVGLSIELVAKVLTPIASFGMIFQSSTPFSWIPTAVGCLLAFMLGATNLASFTGVLEKTVSLGFTMASVTSVTRLLNDSILQLVPFVYETITGKKWMVEEMMTNLTQFQDFVSSVESFEARSSGLDGDYNKQREVKEIHQKYKALLLEAEKLKLRTTLMPLILSYARKVEAWSKIVERSGIYKSGLRQEPVGILLAGEPGIGKSYIVNQLVKDIGGDEVPWKGTPGETIANHIYSRNVQDPHANNYYGQFCYLLDDFGQLRDSESGNGNPEFYEVIMGVSGNAYLMRAATIEDKPNCFFVSKLLIATTNLKSLGPTVVKSIIAPAALHRRFSAHAIMKRDANGVLQFHMQKDGATDVVYNYAEFVNVCRAHYRDRSAQFAKKLAAGENNGTNIAHMCVAKGISLISAPSTVEGTAMKRKQYDPSAPDHSYCHESLPCRQSPQAFWDLFSAPAPAEPAPVTYNLSYAHIRAFPTMLNRLALTPEDELWIAQNEEESEELEFDLDNIFMDLQDGARFDLETPDLNFLKSRRQFTVRPDHIEDMANIYRANTITLLNWGFHLPTESRNMWAASILHLMKRVFNGVTGLLADLWNYVVASPALRAIIATAGYFGVIYGLTCLEFKIANYVFSWVYPDEYGSDIEEEMVKILQELYESRDEKGAQVGRKGQTVRMIFESNDPKAWNLLVIKEIDLGYRKLRVLGINDEIMEALSTCVDPAERSDLIDMMQTAFKAYGNLVSAAALTGKKGNTLETTVLMTKFVEKMMEKGMTMNEVCQMTGHEKFKDILAATETPEDVKKVMFNTMIQNPQSRQEYQGSADQNCDGISAKLMFNVCDIGLTNAIERTAQVFFVKGRIAWINKHAFKQLCGDSKFKITWYAKDKPAQSLNIAWSECKIIEHPNTDIALIQFPTRMKAFQCAIKYLADDADINFEYFMGGRLLTRRNGLPANPSVPNPRFNT